MEQIAQGSQTLDAVLHPTRCKVRSEPVVSVQIDLLTSRSAFAGDVVIISTRDHCAPSASVVFLFFLFCVRCSVPSVLKRWYGWRLHGIINLCTIPELIR
jgi:hypothetical protein